MVCVLEDALEAGRDDGQDKGRVPRGCSPAQARRDGSGLNGAVKEAEGADEMRMGKGINAKPRFLVKCMHRRWCTC